MHPVLRPRGLTCTAPPLTEFVQEFGRLVRNGELAMVCYGPFRHGKSTAAAFIRNSLKQSKKMAVFWALLEEDSKQQDGPHSIWYDLLRGSELDERNERLGLIRPYDSLFRCARADAARFDTNIVLLVIDEAQNLTLDKLGALKKFVDELIEHGLAPFVLLMAQPQVLTLPDRLKKQGRHDLVDRFFTQLYRFRGLQPGEFRDVLAFYDNTEWPVGSGVTYTAHFAPKPWQRQWRMADQTGLFVSAFSQLAASLKVERTELGMKYLVTAVRALLIALQDRPDCVDNMSDVVWSCVQQSGLREASHVVGDSVKAALLPELARKGRRS